MYNNHLCDGKLKKIKLTHVFIYLYRLIFQKIHMFIYLLLRKIFIVKLILIIKI